MKNFRQKLSAIVERLGLGAKLQAKQLTPEENQSIVDAYNAEHGENSFSTDAAAFHQEQEAAARAAELDNTFKALAGIIGAASEGEQKNEATPAGIVDAVRDLTDEVKALRGATMGDKPEDTAQVTVQPTGMHTATHAFGIQHELFAATRRHNLITITGKITGTATRADKDALFADTDKYVSMLHARYLEHKAAGTLPALIQGKLDITAAANDPEIGTRQLTVRQDALIARLAQLPTLVGIFDTASNIQSGQLLTNLLIGEVSQAYQKGRVFKGNFKVQPEKGYVRKVMAKVIFEDMTDLETSYLNALNKEGSSPVKWTLIEWLVLHLATRIRNERNTRAVLGHYVEAEEGVAGPYLFAADGVVHTLFGYCDAHKLLPFKEEELSAYDKDTIGEAIEAFCEKVAEYCDSMDSMVLYLNRKHHAWYKSWYEKTYGQNNDYTGVNSSKVHNYDIPIKWVPNMGNLCLMVMTYADNITLLENVPGEEFNMYFQRDLEEVIAASYWKEGAAAAFVGRAFATQAELVANNYEEQAIFMNWPAVALGADATVVDAKSGLIFLTGKNSKATAITDIANLKEGTVIRVEIGDATYPTSIAKSGKFADISAAWTPTKVGEYIKLYRKGDKFVEVARG